MGTLYLNANSTLIKSINFLKFASSSSSLSFFFLNKPSGETTKDKSPPKTTAQHRVSESKWVEKHVPAGGQLTKASQSSEE